MATLKELENIYLEDAKVRITGDYESNNTCNKVGRIQHISSYSEQADILFDSGQNVKYRQWWVAFELIYPEVISFLDIR